MKVCRGHRQGAGGWPAGLGLQHGWGHSLASETTGRAGSCPGTWVVSGAAGHTGGAGEMRSWGVLGSAQGRGGRGSTGPKPGFAGRFWQVLHVSAQVASGASVLA